MTTAASSVSPAGHLPGAFVISLDFELLWGVRDLYPPGGGAYPDHLLGARAAIPRLLDLFAEYRVAATWATVGLLFADDRTEQEAFFPAARPRYHDPRLDPYGEPVGANEADDPLHFAPSLIARICDTPRQELATHTFGHYYAIEPGTDAESFRADLGAAVAIAQAKGFRLRSIVYPRDQHNPAFTPILREAGIVAYRGDQPGWMYQARKTAQKQSHIRRAARLADTYVPLTRMTGAPWPSVREPGGLCNVPASAFLRPYVPALRRLEPLRLRRLKRGMEAAARGGRIFHLWWHPHNIGCQTDENLAVIRELLEHHRRLRDRYGVESLTMAEVACRANQNHAGPKRVKQSGNPL